MKQSLAVVVFVFFFCIMHPNTKKKFHSEQNLKQVHSVPVMNKF